MAYGGKLFFGMKAFYVVKLKRVVMDGEISSPCNVLSSAPQGTVLGLVLFNTIYDSIALQNDLNKLYTWCHRWKMEFSVSKCY